MQPANISPKDRLIVALDLPRRRGGSNDCAPRRQRELLQDRLSARLCRRPPARAQLANAGRKVFIDLKLHDIGNTVARGVESIARLGATFLTVMPIRRP